jgi:hypothetical protein
MWSGQGAGKVYYCYAVQWSRQRIGAFRVTPRGRQQEPMNSRVQAASGGEAEL